MLVVRFIRFILGYVEFKAQGSFPERFLNLCELNKIILWDLRRENSAIAAKTDCSSYKKIRPVAKKARMKVGITRRFGAPFFLRRHSRRIGILIGVCCCALILAVLSTRIWSVDVAGNSRVPRDEIIGAFEELGVKRGAKRSGINVKSTEIAALQRLPELVWLNVNLEGSAARIEVREREKIAPENNSDAPADIVAARDGQIVVLRPFNGAQIQKVGNAAVKGELLISGVEENKDLTVSFLRASGYVVARTERNLSAFQSKKIAAEVPVEEKKTLRLNFLVFSVPFGSAGEKAYLEERGVRVNGVELPISATRSRETVCEKRNIDIGDENARLLASLKFFEKCCAEFRRLKLEKWEISAENSEKGAGLEGKFVCLENIGEERPIQIENAPSGKAAEAKPYRE